MQTLVLSLRNGFRRAGNVERESCGDEVAHVFLAANDFEIFFVKKTGKSGETFLRPFLIEEMIVATGALHFGGHENLGGVGRGLDSVAVRFIADEAVDIGLAVGAGDIGCFMARHGGVEQFGDEEIEGFVFDKAGINEIGIIAVSGNAAGGGLTGEGVFPKGRPLGGVISVAGEERVDEFGAFVGGFILGKGLAFPGGRDHADQIEVNTAGKSGVIAKGGGLSGLG